MLSPDAYMQELECRIEFLEKSILLLLMNNNLHTMMQELLLEEIMRSPRARNGQEIFEKIKEDINWESLVGPNEISQDQLDYVSNALYTKIINYRHYGNLNL